MNLDIETAARSALSAWNDIQWTAHNDQSAACVRAMMFLERALDAVTAAPRMIVAEVSKTWVEGHVLDEHHIAKCFEEVIERNENRGYRLHSWQFQTSTVASFSAMGSMAESNVQLVETIVAVFEKGGNEA